MSSRRLQDTSSRRLQDMSSRGLQDVFSVTIFYLPRRLQDVLRDVFKKSSRRLRDVFARRLGRQKIVTLKTCWRRLQDMSWRRLQDQQMFAGILAEWPFIKIHNIDCNGWYSVWLYIEWTVENMTISSNLILAG